MFDFRVFFFLKIGQNQPSMFGRQLCDTAIKTRELQLSLLRSVCRIRQSGHWLSPHVLEMYFVSDTIKITRRFAGVSSLDLRKFAGYAVDRFVGQVFGFQTTAASEYLDESECE